MNFLNGFIVVACIAVIHFYIEYKQKQPLTVEKMWEQSEKNVKKVFEKSLTIENYLQYERELVIAMKKDMIRLRERFKHDIKKQNEIARDWIDYSYAIVELKYNRELLDCDMESGAHDRYEERTKEIYVLIQEIDSRVEKELGKDANFKQVHDRFRPKK